MHFNICDLSQSNVEYKAIKFGLVRSWWSDKFCAVKGRVGIPLYLVHMRTLYSVNQRCCVYSNTIISMVIFLWEICAMWETWWPGQLMVRLGIVLCSWARHNRNQDKFRKFWATRLVKILPYLWRYILIKQKSSKWRSLTLGVASDSKVYDLVKTFTA